MPAKKSVRRPSPSSVSRQSARPGRRPGRKAGPNPNAGISRIAQPEKRTFGFFVRLMRKGKIYNAFFADKSHGGQRKALEAARAHYQLLLKEHGPSVRGRPPLKQRSRTVSPAPSKRIKGLARSRATRR
jgi:hypothetical protein